MLYWLRSPRLGNGSTKSASGAFSPSLRLLSVKVSANGISACWPPLAFLSPQIVAAIIDGTAPADLTVTGLAKRSLSPRPDAGENKANLQGIDK
jgi:hypothetical protein